MKRLSETMTKAIRAILAQGDWAIPEGGGWWKGCQGIRLTIDADKDTVSTRTIYALEERGFLHRLYQQSERWRDTYEVTGQVLIVADPWAAAKSILIKEVSRP